MILKIEELAQQIEMSQKSLKMETAVIVVDGCGGSGKSTLSKRLSTLLDDCPVIQTDDFASWDNPFNWYNRMLDQVLVPLIKNQAARYQRYDWIKKKLDNWITVSPQKFVIVEGVSSARKEFRPYIAFTFLCRPIAKLGCNEV